MAEVQVDDLESPAARRVQGAPPRSTHPYAHLVFAVLLVCAGYYAGGVVAVALRLEPGGISGVWLPHGVLLAALVLTPVRLWWFYFVALLPVHLHLVSQFQGPVPLVVMLMQFGGNLLQAICGWIALRYTIGAAPRLDTLRNMTVFLVVGVFLPVLAVSALVAGLFLFAGWVGDFWLAWQRRTLAGVLGAIVLAPVLVQVCDSEAAAIRAAPRRRQLEYAVLTTGVVALAMPALGGESSLASSHALLFAPLPLLLWTAVRFGPAGLAPQLLVVTLAALTVTKVGHGPFVSTSAGESVLSVQAFLLSVSVPLLLLSALVAEGTRSAQALREGEERLRLALAAGRMGAWDWDLRRKTVTRSGEHLEIMGLPPFSVELGEEVWARRVHPDDRLRAEAAMREAIAERGQYRCEYRASGPDGAPRWVEERAQPIYDERGRCVRVMGLIIDITDRKQVDQASEQLAHVSRLAVMGELMASIAHEINQPLGAILSNADAAEILLNQHPVPLDELRHVVDDIRRDDMRAGDVIRHMRALMRKRELAILPFDLNGAVRDVLHLASADLGQRRVSVTTEFGQLPIMHGDRVHVQQVVLNLILNGVDAMAELPASGRRLDIRTVRSAGGGEVEVSVSDTGPGVPPEQGERLFESFYTTKKEGMGLGLSIARSIVEAHGGRIWAQNCAGGGASFIFSIPVQPAGWTAGMTTAHPSRGGFSGSRCG